MIININMIATTTVWKIVVATVAAIAIAAIV